MGKEEKRSWLGDEEPLVVKLDVNERKNLTRDLIKELFLEHTATLDEWKRITGQPSQVDSGYIAQHLISLITGIPGHGLRGKGLDLGDGSQIKCASCIGGIDIPRWNLEFHGRTDGEIRRKMDDLLKAPMIYLVLFDENKFEKLRIRVWAVDPDKDEAFQRVFSNWRERDRKSNNFQLHPPVRKDSDVTTNLSGNLKLPLIYLAEENEKGEIILKLFTTKPSRNAKYIERSKIDRLKNKSKGGWEI